MMRQEKTTIGGLRIVGALLLAVIGVSGLASLAAARELVRAKFTLSAETRFGATVLPAGRYELLVEPISAMRAVGSPVAISVRSEDGARMAAVLAKASQQDCDASGLTLHSDGSGFVAQSLCLQAQQLTLHFDLSRSGGKLL
jgi:hypothetical protein